jgi:hypothetical protein
MNRVTVFARALVDSFLGASSLHLATQFIGAFVQKGFDRRVNDGGSKTHRINLTIFSIVVHSWISVDNADHRKNVPFDKVELARCKKRMRQHE